ncbi:type I polyketide synthase [Micromonospora sp. NPDC005686]|uniref:type I polyketide synthase n=1 Tax=unclassified Micromonospora TaxID=2617518 RepID=UPI0033B0E73E
MADEEKLRQYLKKATGELQVTTRRLHEAELKDSEPIAIVGMGCRFPPDLRSPEDLWRFLVDERDAVAPFPADRGWDASSPLAEAMPPPRGGFVTGVDRFDAGFFGIGETEALAMDPQQRLLLETAWDAVEHAGMDPAALRGTPAGVYAGVSYCHYGAGPQAELPPGVGDQLIIGGTPSTTSGRVSYVMGLRGPAISVDTACSSSLVAIHLACQALRRGDCDLALAGGVTVMATPGVIIEFGRRGALAADGRCKPFAAAADGMGFGEGAGLLVLERLSVALRKGRSVLALIRGSAVNQDGATNGLTSPSRSAQEAVIRQALAEARLDPDQVDAVEGHGTGTALGDSIEAEALIATYGKGRTSGRPLRLGSLKSNIGHTQTASGVAGVIKMVMSMRAGRHARTLHVDRPSDYVDWSGGTVVLTTGSGPWPSDGRPRRAGVSSFGISGTNAHVVVEEPPEADADDSAPAPDAACVPWVLSAKSEPALRAMAARLRDLGTGTPAAAARIGIALARTRAGYRYRAVSVGTGLDEHLAALAALASGADAPGLTTGSATTAKPTLVFTGGEPADDDSVAGLARRFPAFAEAYDDVRARLDAHLGRPLRAYRQAAVFAHQAALWHLVDSCGVAPGLVAGSGVGEITAAHVAGVLSLADAVALVAAVSRASDAADPAGREALRATTARIGYAEPRVALTLTGDARDPDHWATGAFGRAGAGEVLSRVRSPGPACLELGPEAVTTAADVLTRLADAYAAGAAVSWEATFTGTGARPVRLPGYPFQRERYWLAASGSRVGAGEIVRAAVHPLLGGPIDLADSTGRRYAATLTAGQPWYAAAYRLRGTPVLPPAAVAEWALAAARHGAHSGDVWTIEDVTLAEPVPVPAAVQTSVETGGDALRIKGYSAGPGDAERGWALRFTASATRRTPPAPPTTDLDRLRAGMTEHDPADLFARLAAAGVDSGPAFRQVVRRWWRTDAEALALVETDVAGADDGRHLVHPVILESCFLTALTLVTEPSPRVPSRLSRLTRHRELPQRVWCHVRRTADGRLDLELRSDAGEPLVSVAGLAHAAVELPDRRGVPAAPEAAEPWDAARLSLLAVEEPQAAREALTELLFSRVTGMVDGRVEDREDLRVRFPRVRLGDLGLDSLRAMRLREQFRAELGVDVPPQRLLGDGTVADIVDLVCRSLAARRLMAAEEEPQDAGLIEELIL